MAKDIAPSIETIPEELYNLTQLAEVTLAAGRLSTTNVNEIREYIKLEKHKQQNCSVSSPIKELEQSSNTDTCSPPSKPVFRRRHTVQGNWNRNIEAIKDDLLLTRSSLMGDKHSVIKRNHSTPTILDYNIDQIYITPNKCASIASERTSFLSSSDDDSNYYSHKIFDRKKSRRSTISDNSKHDEHSCSSIPSSGDEHFSQHAMCSNSNDIQGNFNDRPCSNSNINSPDDDHICPECGKKYSTSSNLARHRQTHRSILDKKAKRCPHCDKVYVSMPAYSMHVRTHNQGCECPHCGKCFSRPWLLQGHIRTHTGEKPFKCNICSKAFADKSNLRAHVQTHSNTKPHACSRCGKAFALKSYLYKHEESSCMRNHAKHERERVKSARTDTTRSSLVSKILRRDTSSTRLTMRSEAINQNEAITGQNSNHAPMVDQSLLRSAIGMDMKPISKSDSLTEEQMEKSYTTLTTPMSQSDYDRFSRISVIRTPQTSQCTMGLSQSNEEITTPGNMYDATNNLHLNFYQENPVDFSPKNSFSHSSKTSPFEITGSYAIVA